MGAERSWPSISSGGMRAHCLEKVRQEGKAMAEQRLQIRSKDTEEPVWSSSHCLPEANRDLLQPSLEFRSLSAQVATAVSSSKMGLRETWLNGIQIPVSPTVPLLAAVLPGPFAL